MAGNHGKPETAGAQKNGQQKKRGRKGEAKGKKNPKKQGRASLEEPESKERATRTATGKVRRTKTRPGGRPARPGQEEEARAHTAEELGMVSSNPKGKVLVPTRNNPGAPAEGCVARQTVRKTSCVTDRLHTRQTTAAHATQDRPGGTRQGQPHSGAPNRYDVELAVGPSRGRGQRQAPLRRPKLEHVCTGVVRKMNRKIWWINTTKYPLLL